jgi:hypothetical protein
VAVKILERLKNETWQLKYIVDALKCSRYACRYVVVRVRGAGAARTVYTRKPACGLTLGGARQFTDLDFKEPTNPLIETNIY